MHINPQIGPDGQNGRRDLQCRGVVQAFEVRREEERCPVDEGKCAGGLEDGVAERAQDGEVEGGEDGVLEDYVEVDGACGCGWSFCEWGIGLGREGKGSEGKGRGEGRKVRYRT